MSLLTFVHAFAMSGVLACSLSTVAAAADLPTEVDTVVVGRTVVLTGIQGEILRQLTDGSLAPISDGDSVRPGEVLLVRRGASFNIGNDTIGAEAHGDRWVKFE